MSEGDQLLPDTATAFEQAQSATSARLLDAPTQIVRDARRGASAPEQLLPFLAWERSVHHTSDAEATMRARIDSAFADHLAYGSPAALEEEIALDTGVAVQIREFFEIPGGAWPDFFVVIPVGPGHPAPPDDMGPILRSALRRKNVRDWPGVRLESRPDVVPASVSVGLQVRLTIRPTPSDGRVRTPVVPHIGVGAIITVKARLEPL
ncbi:MAG: phage tail protein I [Rhodoblastus sp.]